MSGGAVYKITAEGSRLAWDHPKADTDMDIAIPPKQTCCRKHATMQVLVQGVGGVYETIPYKLNYEN